MITYYVEENNEIVKTTQSEYIANLWGQYKTTEKEIVLGWDGKLYFDGTVPPKPTDLINQEKIKELKEKLNETDYKAIKYAEGWYSDEEYEEIKAQREAWRDEIRELEAQIEPTGENSIADGG